MHMNNRNANELLWKDCRQHIGPSRIHSDWQQRHQLEKLSKLWQNLWTKVQWTVGVHLRKKCRNRRLIYSSIDRAWCETINWPPLLGSYLLWFRSYRGSKFHKFTKSPKNENKNDLEMVRHYTKGFVGLNWHAWTYTSTLL